MMPGTPMPAPRNLPVLLNLPDRSRMASHISLITWSRPRATLVPRVTFSRSCPSALTAAMRRLVPPRSTPMEKSGMRGDYQNRDGAVLTNKPSSFARPDSRGRLSLHESLLLALRAVVAAAAGDHDAFDGRFADETGLAFAAID